MIASRNLFKLTVFAFLALTETFGLTKAAEVTDKCAYLASIEPDKVREALTIYADKVMGKYVEHWTSSDFANLIANAVACDGMPLNKSRKVNAFYWKTKIVDAQKSNFEINNMSLRIASGYAKYWNKSDEFPACVQFMKWKRDDIWYSNNSKEIFGQDFSEMSADELGFYRKISQECLPVMQKISFRWRVDAKDAETLVSIIQETIDLEAKAIPERSNNIPDKLKIKHGGRFVPYAFLRPTTQKIMNRIAEVEINNRILPTNAIIQISRWAGQVVKGGNTGPDLEYAKLVQKKLTDQMFKAAEMLGEPKEYSANPNKN